MDNAARRSLDRFDLKILEVWQERGDIGAAELAQVVPLSASQCARRMQQLRHAGFVRAVPAVLDGDKLGIGFSAYVLLTMASHDPEACEAFHARIHALDEIVECQKLAGSADMIVKVATHDLAAFNRLLTQKLLAAPEVATAHSSSVLECVKSTTRLPLRFATGD